MCSVPRRRGEIGKRFQEQHPELWDQYMDVFSKVVEDGKEIKNLMDRGEFHPTRYEDMNATYHALVPQYHLVYEAYKKMHELLTPGRTAADSPTTSLSCADQIFLRRIMAFRA